jgi:DNA processing protein
MRIHQGVGMNDLHGWLRLQVTPGVGAQAAAGLLRRYGSPAAIFQQSERELRQCLRPELAQALLGEPSSLAALEARVTGWLSHSAPGVSHAVWTWGDERYPQSLLALSDPPLLLYAQGQLSQAIAPALALVGSRNPTPQGLENARVFGRHLAQAGYAIVSGLAWGIDAATHQGALEATVPIDRCPTLAVVGTGLDRVYPERNVGLAQQIAQRGLLVSEYPPGTAPMAHHFPQRNRLIAALSSAVLVVEASLKSGSLITAKLALELGREVMAIPGSIHSAQARGCHALIRQGAKLVESMEDVLEELAPMPHAVPSAPAKEPQAASPSVLLSAVGFDPVTIEVLAQRTEWAIPALQAGLLNLELTGEVARLPGGFFQRLHRL